MKSITTKHDCSQPVAATAVHLFDDWFDPIETCVRERAREFIGAMWSKSSVWRRVRVCEAATN